MGHAGHIRGYAKVCQVLCLQGSDAFKRKDYEGAISLYSQALTGAPKVLSQYGYMSNILCHFPLPG